MEAMARYDNGFIPGSAGLDCHLNYNVCDSNQFGLLLPARQYLIFLRCINKTAHQFRVFVVEYWLVANRPVYLSMNFFESDFTI